MQQIRNWEYVTERELLSQILPNTHPHRHQVWRLDFPYHGSCHLTLRYPETPRKLTRAKPGTVENVIRCGELGQCLPEFRKRWLSLERQPAKDSHEVLVSTRLHALCLLARGTAGPKLEANSLD